MLSVLVVASAAGKLPVFIVTLIVILNYYALYKYYYNNNHLMAVCPGQPG